MKTIKKTNLQSKFAPPERLNSDEINEQYNSFTHEALLEEVFNSVPVIIMILNDERQIVYSNGTLLHFLGVDRLRNIIGMRPGEVLHCIHSQEMEAGCGTSHECSFCGTVHAILKSQKTKEQATGESRITSEYNGEIINFDILVTSKPFRHSDSWYYMLTIQDISDKKRRRALERIFFHDVTNTAFGLKGHVDYLLDTDNPETTHSTLPLLKTCSDLLLEEINAQKILASAESNDLKLECSEFPVSHIVKDVVHHLEKHYSALGKNIELINPNWTGTLSTDKRLLTRVLINMLKNALEASGKGETVTIGYRPTDNGMEFHVHNSGHMSEEAKSQIFQRSFSTKGAGRGLGTYSMKLLTEKYLEGEISFTSEEKAGTIFSVTLPLTHPRCSEPSH
jgi:nitrogen-specific signal transduction histidine kinase